MTEQNFANRRKSLKLAAFLMQVSDLFWKKDIFSLNILPACAIIEMKVTTIAS